MDNNLNNDDVTAEVGGNYVLCPTGNHVATCFAMVVIGTVMESFQGKPAEPAKKVIFGFEITGKKHIFKEERGPEPHILWIEHLLSLNTKANLRKMIQSWAGEQFTDEDMKTFKINDLVGNSCLANVVAFKTSKGEDRVKIYSISSVPEGTPVLPLVNKSLIFTYRNPFNTEAFDRIPEWIQKKMKTSQEYQQALGAGIVPTQTTQTPGPVATEQPKGGFPFPKKPM
jgi:hypothetical protein